MIITSEDAEKEVILYVAKLMVAAARTAPKARGIDTTKSMILIEGEKEQLFQQMVNDAKGELTPTLKSIQNATAIVLFGVDYDKTKPPEDSTNKFKLIDLGIAVGSAVKIASILNVDNRIHGGPARTALKMGIIKADEVVSVCLSLKGKNIFFDRPGYVSPSDRQQTAAK